MFHELQTGNLIGARAACRATLRMVPWALLAAACLSRGVLAQEDENLPTWAFLLALDGQRLTLDDGSVLRLGANTKVLRADGSAGTIDDIYPGAKLVIAPGAGDTPASVQVFRPRPLSEVYLYDLAPDHGGGSGGAVVAGGRLWPRSVSTLRATYARNRYWTGFQTGVAFLPDRAPGSVPAVSFVVLDVFGDVLFQQAVSGGGTGQIHLGFAADSAPERVTLEVRPAGDGVLRQEWCHWLDPHFLAAPSGGSRSTFDVSTVQTLVDDLLAGPGAAQAGSIAVATFTAVRFSDDYALRDLSDDLIVLLGKKAKVAGEYGQRLNIGRPLSENEKNQLGKMGADAVVVGSCSQRAEGIIINAVLLRVEDSRLLAAATVRQF